MTLIAWLKARKTLWMIAAQKGCSVTHVRRSIQECIDDAWNRTWSPGNIRAQVNWQRLFPGGEKPTVEQFIICLAQAPDSFLFQ